MLLFILHILFFTEKIVHSDGYGAAPLKVDTKQVETIFSKSYCTSVFKYIKKEGAFAHSFVNRFSQIPVPPDSGRTPIYPYGS